MKTFHCDGCGGLVFFENTLCLSCGHSLAYMPDVQDLTAYKHGNAAAVVALNPAAQFRSYRLCDNADKPAACNWLVAAEDSSPFCISCRMNQCIPDLSVAANHDRWHKLELAKRYLLYGLFNLHLPLTGSDAESPSLRFQFLSEMEGRFVVQTGHENGLITLNIAEADDPERELRRVNLHEPFRTLLGHFRHEVGHYYWDRLIRDSGWLEPFREVFGDEQADYEQALKRHYENGPPADWSGHSISAYASSHPWEDWAETWAHYLHMVDTIETAAAFGMLLKPQHPAAKTMVADPGQIVRKRTDFDAMVETWVPLTYTLNSLNRGMGLSDLYPFVLSSGAIEKLRFVHQVICAMETDATGKNEALAMEQAVGA